MIDLQTGKIINPLSPGAELTTITITKELFDDLKFIRHSGFIPYTFVDNWTDFLEFLLNRAVEQMDLKEKLQQKYSEFEEIESKGSDVQGTMGNVQHNINTLDKDNQEPKGGKGDEHFY